MGNSVAVAAKHYRQVTEAHFQRAVSGSVEAVRNAVQPLQQSACSDTHAGTRNAENHEKTRGFCNSNWTIQDSNL